MLTKCKNKSEISGLNQGVCVQIREIFPQSLAFQIIFTDLWRRNWRGIFRTMHQLKNSSCQRCSCCFNFKWRPSWEIFLSFCIAYILSRFLLVFWGLIFWPATSFHGLISLNMVRVVRETAKKQREQTHLISHCKEPILCWLHLKELADMCTSFTLWSLYSFLSNTVGNSSVNKKSQFHGCFFWRSIKDL